MLIHYWSGHVTRQGQQEEYQTQPQTIPKVPGDESKQELQKVYGKSIKSIYQILFTFL